MLGWSLDRYYASTLYELTVALEGYDLRRQNELVNLAQLAAWVTRGAREAHHAKSFNAPKYTDFYDPDAKPIKSVADMTAEERKAMREGFMRRFSPTLPKQPIEVYEP